MSLFQPSSQENAIKGARLQPEDLQGCAIDRPFELDGFEWPTAEHYYQAMKYPGRPRADALLATGEEDILEVSLYDYFWGVGRDLRGQNQYGKVLMAVRRKLLSHAKSHPGSSNGLPT